MKLNTALKFTALWLIFLRNTNTLVTTTMCKVRYVTTVAREGYANINLDTFRQNHRVSNVYKNYHSRLTLSKCGMSQRPLFWQIWQNLRSTRFRHEHMLIWVPGYRLGRARIYTKDENPGKGARDLALLFMTSWVPFKLTTALFPSWSEDSVKLEYPRAEGIVGFGGACCTGFCFFHDCLKVLFTFA